MNKVSHFELPVENVEEAKHFYEHLFGWQFVAMKNNNADYWIVRTAETDEEGMLKETGAINGGLYRRQDPKDHTTVVAEVFSIDKTVAMAKEHGASVLMPKNDVGDMGYYAKIMDPQGNLIGLWENKKPG